MSGATESAEIQRLGSEIYEIVRTLRQARDVSMGDANRGFELIDAAIERGISNVREIWRKYPPSESPSEAFR